MAKPLNQQIVLITGASSGIGRLTAELLAQAGAKLVLAARNETALAQTAEICRQRGTEALAIPTDVSHREQVQHLINSALAHFGRIDTLINNAGVTEYGYVDDMPVEEIERVMQVNFMGQVYAIKALLPHFKEQKAGTIINVSSGLGERAVPLQAAYCASKHAVKGFTEALRLELKKDYPAINLTLIMPSSINTPLFSHARTRLPVKPRPVPLVYQPEVAAKAIVEAVAQPKRDVVVGEAAKMLIWLQHLSPSLVDRMLLFGDVIFKTQQTKEPSGYRDNLFSAFDTAQSVRGEWGKESLGISPFTDLLESHPARKTWLKAGGLAGLVALLATRKRS